MNSYQGIFDEWDSATASIENIDAALKVVVDSGIRLHLIELRKEMLRAQAQSIRDFHHLWQTESLEIAA